MKCFILFILSVSLLGCNDQMCCCFDLHGHIDLKVFDSHGNDLLNPDNPDSYYEPHIQIKYLIEGKVVQGFHGSLGHGYTNLFQELHSEDYILRIYVNRAESEEFPITYINWDINDTDTLKFHFDRGDCYVDWDQVWYNGVKQNVDMGGQRIITVVK